MNPGTSFRTVDLRLASQWSEIESMAWVTGQSTKKLASSIQKLPGNLLPLGLGNCLRTEKHPPNPKEPKMACKSKGKKPPKR